MAENSKTPSGICLDIVRHSIDISGGPNLCEWDWGLSIELLFSRKIASPLLRHVQHPVGPRREFHGSSSILLGKDNDDREF